MQQVYVTYKIFMIKYFMIKSPRKNVADPEGVNRAASCSPVWRVSNWYTEAGK